MSFEIWTQRNNLFLQTMIFTDKVNFNLNTLYAFWWLARCIIKAIVIIVIIKLWDLSDKKEKIVVSHESVEQREIISRNEWNDFYFVLQRKIRRRGEIEIFFCHLVFSRSLESRRAHLEDATIARENEIVLRNCETCRKSVAEWDEMTIKMIRKYESKQTNPVEKLHFGNSFHFFFLSFFFVLYTSFWLNKISLEDGIKI